MHLILVFTFTLFSSTPNKSIGTNVSLVANRCRMEPTQYYKKVSETAMSSNCSLIVTKSKKDLKSNQATLDLEYELNTFPRRGIA